MVEKPGLPCAKGPFLDDERAEETIEAFQIYTEQNDVLKKYITENGYLIK